jgi:hypothetical protein
MNKLFFILFLLPVGLFAQSYTETVDVPGKDAASLYKKAKEWFTESSNVTANEPLKEDVAKGILAGKEKLNYLIYSNNVAINVIANYVFRIIVKDGQFKYEVDNVMIEHGTKFPLAAFKNGLTREGTIEMYKAAGMKSPSKKMIESNIDYNTKVVTGFETELKRVTDSLKERMAN